MESKKANVEQYQQWNRQFSQAETERAMQAIQAEVMVEKQRKNRNCELYHALKNPFEENTPEYVYIKDLITKGSERDAEYVDLFSCVQNELKTALAKTKMHSFFMLNCRFSEQSEDNFLLYVIADWES